MIEELIEQYNTVEAEQQARLRQLFALVKARAGFREVLFASRVQWTNCWNMESPRFDELYFQQLTREIVKFSLGEEA